MKTFQREVQLRTAGGLTVTDITDDVRDAVRESGIQAGICCIYSPHTTCSVRINEWERGFLEDFAVMLKRSSTETVGDHLGSNQAFAIKHGLQRITP